MLVGVQTSGVINRFGIDGGFAVIKEAGFEALDFNLDSLLTWRQIAAEGALEFFSDEEKVKAYTEEIKATAEKHGLVFGQFHAPFPTFFKDNDHANANVLLACIKSIEICAACGCDKLVVHPRMHWDINNPITPEEEWQINIDFYSALIPHLKKHHVICCLENMWLIDNRTQKIYTSACGDMNMAVKYIDTLNDIAGERVFGFCLDMGHLLIACGDFGFSIKTLGDRLVALHIHDNNGRTDDHTAPYIGGVGKWDRFLWGLREIGYKGNLSFETANAASCYPDALVPSVLRLLADTGNYFRDELQK